MRGLVEICNFVCLCAFVFVEFALVVVLMVVTYFVFFCVCVITLLAFDFDDCVLVDRDLVGVGVGSFGFFVVGLFDLILGYEFRWDGFGLSCGGFDFIVDVGYVWLW